MRETSRVVRLPHATVAMVAEINRRSQFKAAFVEVLVQTSELQFCLHVDTLLSLLSSPTTITKRCEH
jgi:hypothetical protein